MKQEFFCSVLSWFPRFCPVSTGARDHQSAGDDPTGDEQKDKQKERLSSGAEIPASSPREGVSTNALTPAISKFCFSDQSDLRRRRVDRSGATTTKRPVITERINDSPPGSALLAAMS